MILRPFIFSLQQLSRAIGLIVVSIEKPLTSFMNSRRPAPPQINRIALKRPIGHALFLDEKGIDEKEKEEEYTPESISSPEEKEESHHPWPRNFVLPTKFEPTDAFEMPLQLDNFEWIVDEDEVLSNLNVAELQIFEDLM